MTTIKLLNGSLGRETMMVRCDLSQASAPVQVNYMNGRYSEWEGTQYQCADAHHTDAALIEIGKKLAASAVEVSADEFDCESEEV